MPFIAGGQLSSISVWLRNIQSADPRLFPAVLSELKSLVRWEFDLEDMQVLSQIPITVEKFAFNDANLYQSSSPIGGVYLFVITDKYNAGFIVGTCLSRYIPNAEEAVPNIVDVIRGVHHD